MTERAENPVLEIRDLRVAYTSRAGDPALAVNGVSFIVHPGETVGLLGESGCGKSTIAVSLLGLLPKRGSICDGIVRFKGRELQKLTEREWEKVRGAEIAMIPQDPALALSPVLRVGEQIADVVQAHRKWKRAKCREKAEQLLRSVHLDHVARIFSSYPFQLSGGQLQRIVIAQALSCEPSLLIADEPTSALDPIMRAEILSLFQELKQQRSLALLFISHEPEILALLADRILVMQGGTILEEGTFAELRDHPASTFTRDLLAAMRQPKKVESGSASKGNSLESTQGLALNRRHRR